MLGPGPTAGEAIVGPKGAALPWRVDWIEGYALDWSRGWGLPSLDSSRVWRVGMAPAGMRPRLALWLWKCCWAWLFGLLPKFWLAAVLLLAFTSPVEYELCNLGGVVMMWLPAEERIESDVPSFMYFKSREWRSEFAVLVDEALPLS